MFVFFDFVVLFVCFLEWDKIDEMVKDDILFGWLVGFVDGLLIVKFDVIVLFFMVR